MTLRTALFLVLFLGVIGCAEGPVDEAPLSDEIPRATDLTGVDPEVTQLIANGIAMVEADPSAALPRAGLGMIYHANERFELARTAYRQALLIEPENARWLYHLARVEERLGLTESALERIRASLELESTYAPSYWRRGGWQLDLGDPVAAEADFRQAIEIAPRDPAGPTGLARALLAQDRVDEARRVLERLVQDLPDDPLVHLLLGNAYRALGRVDDAERHLKLGQGEQVTREDGWTANDILRFQLGFGAQMQMAVTLAGAGQVEEAVTILEELRERDAEDARLLRHLGRNYMLVGRSDEALQTLKKGLELYPDDPKMLGEVASAFHISGDSSGALELFERAIEIKPEDSLAHARRGAVLQSLKRYPEAVESFQAALVYRPQDRLLMRRMGDCLTAMQRYEAAAGAYRGALELTPDDPDLLVRMGFALQRLGQYKVAEQAVAKALDLSPGNPEWAKFLQEIRRQAQDAPAGQD